MLGESLLKPNDVESNLTHEKKLGSQLTHEEDPGSNPEIAVNYIAEEARKVASSLEKFIVELSVKDSDEYDGPPRDKRRLQNFDVAKKADTNIRKADTLKMTKEKLTDL